MTKARIQDSESRIQNIKKIWNKPILKIDKLFGDASYRTYHRIQFQDKTTMVLMELPKGKMSASEEITNYQGGCKELPFLNIQRHLETWGLPVAKVLKIVLNEGWIFLEDLGDTRLGDIVRGGNEARLRDWYERALDLLVAMQRGTRDEGRGTKNCIAFQRSFDATLLNWEFEHFWEYYVQNSGVRIQNSEKQHFQEETRKITEELLKLPQIFVHRDFQSRNLMWHKDRLYLIDFQDALMGPYVYDMVALLRDSYVELSKPLRTHLMRYYCEQTKRDLAAFTRAFHLQTLQRKLKDVGRFVYIDKVKGNPNFLTFIPTSLGYVKEAMAELPEYERLARILEPILL